MAAAAFISGLRVNHDFYASLVKHNVTEMCEILRRAPGYIHLEEAQNSNPEQAKAPEKGKTESTTPGKGQNKGGFRKNQQFNNQETFPVNTREIEAPIFNTPINEIFSTIEDQPWIHRPPVLPKTERNVNSKDLCSYHQGT